jgi:hypothetical protein
MARERAIKVTLPEGTEPTPEDLELLDTTAQAIMSLRYEGRREREETLLRLEAEGWQVRCRLGWIAEARRGRECERAFAGTRDQALAELHTLTAMDTPAGVSS